MAVKKYLDPAALTTIWGVIKSQLGLKQDKVDGEGLYPDEDKSKLAGIESGAQVNIIEKISVNGTAKPVAKKAVDLEIPVASTDLSDGASLVHDTNYVHTDNNYTSAEEAKLAGIEAGAQVNAIEKICVNGAERAVDKKAVNISIPTSNTQLSNDAGYQTKTDVKNAVEEYGYQNASQVKTAIDTAIAASGHITRKFVDSLPAKGEDNVIYLIPKEEGSTRNERVEYMWNADESKWEQLGDTAPDLDNYYNTDNLTTITGAEIDALCV